MRCNLQCKDCTNLIPLGNGRKVPAGEHRGLISLKWRLYFGVMRLFLVRHGAVAPERHGSFYGGTEVRLSSEGMAEAREAGRQLRSENLNAIYASPLSRAQFGAKQVAEGRNMQIRTEPGFLEIDRGRWLGRTPEEVQSEYPGDLEAHARDPWSWRSHGGESLGDLRTRVLEALQRVRSVHDQQDSVAIVSHMFPTRAILAEVMGLDLPAWKELEIPTASISLIEDVDGQPVVQFFGRQQL